METITCPVVISAGLFGSASTWAFNATTEILRRAHPDRRIAGFFTDQITETTRDAIRAAPISVIKTHTPTDAFLEMIQENDLPVILSVRDPRDCVISLMERFGISFAEALCRVVDSAAALTDLAGIGTPLVLRYENGVTRGGLGIDTLSRYLGVTLRPDENAAIRQALSPGAVTALITQLTRRGIFDGTAPLTQYDPQTQWHPNHVGNGVIGKYRRLLAPHQEAVVNYRTRGFRALFGYAVAAPAPLPPGAMIDFSESGTGADYLADGFSWPEERGVWTAAERADLVFDLERPARHQVLVELEIFLAPLFFQSDCGLTGAVRVNSGDWRDLSAVGIPSYDQLTLRLTALARRGLDRVKIEFRFSGLRPLTDFGGYDHRMLGCHVTRARIDYD